MLRKKKKEKDTEKHIIGCLKKKRKKEKGNKRRMSSDRIEVPKNDSIHCISDRYTYKKNHYIKKEEKKRDNTLKTGRIASTQIKQHLLNHKFRFTVRIRDRIRKRIMIKSFL